MSAGDGSDWGDRDALGAANVAAWTKKWPTDAEQTAWKDGYETGHALGAIEGEGEEGAPADGFPSRDLADPNVTAEDVTQAMATPDEDDDADAGPDYGWIKVDLGDLRGGLIQVGVRVERDAYFPIGWAPANKIIKSVHNTPEALDDLKSCGMGDGPLPDKQIAWGAVRYCSLDCVISAQKMDADVGGDDRNTDHNEADIKRIIQTKDASRDEIPGTLLDDLEHDAQKFGIRRFLKSAWDHGYATGKVSERLSHDALDVSALKKASPEWSPMPAWSCENHDDTTLPEDSHIKAAHPTKSGRHDLYGQAMRLVGARRSKSSLVTLVTWLLLRIETETRIGGPS